MLQKLEMLPILESTKDNLPPRMGMETLEEITEIPTPAISSLSNADIVMEHAGNKGCAVMLKRRDSGSFAVCLVDALRAIVVAPNYQTQKPEARLLGNLSKRGLSSVLDWTDRRTALRRYTGLVGEPLDCGDGVICLYD